MSDFCEVTAAQKQQLEESDAKWARPPQNTIDQWNIAAGNYGRYNETTGYFELNGLTDITYKEALVIMRNSATVFSLVSGGLPPYAFAKSNIRTTFPLLGNGNAFGPIALTGTFRGCPNLEIVRLLGGNPGAANSTFYECSNLKDCEIRAEFGITFNDMAFGQCSTLSRLYIWRLVSNLNIQNSPHISYDSLQHIVTYAVNTSQITITLHPQAYARVTEDLINLALEKNIIIAST